MTGSATVLDPPASPTAELAFADGDDDERLPFPCTDGDYDEVTIIMAKAPGARAIHARLRYADETEFVHAITHVLPPGEDGDTMFAWAEDRGLPCVKLVAEGPDGRRSEPTVVCEPAGCVEGEGWFEALGRSAEWWRSEHGPGSCAGVVSADPERGCTCVAVADTHAGAMGLFGGLVMLVALGARAGRRSGPVVCPSNSRVTRDPIRRGSREAKTT